MPSSEFVAGRRGPRLGRLDPLGNPDGGTPGKTALVVRQFGEVQDKRQKPIYTAFQKRSAQSE